MQIGDQNRGRKMVQAFRRRRALRAGLTQLLYVGVGVGLGLLVPTFTGGPRIRSAEVAALVAGSIAGLLAVTGIVFALLFLVVQFAATAQSPRLLIFRDNPLVWNALGLIFGVMVYATTCVVVTAGDPTTTVLVPISVIVLVVLTLAIARRLQIDALQSMDLAATLDQITTRTRAGIDRIYTEPFPSAAPDPVARPGHAVQIRWSGAQQVLRQVDLPKLTSLARQADATFHLNVVPGDLVRENAVVLEVWDHSRTPDSRALLKCLDLGTDRTFAQDPLLGFRLLNDLALRAMSTAINDPATAVQALDSIESLLTILVLRDLTIGVIEDVTGTRRVLFDAPEWEVFLGAGADEIAETPMHPMIRRRLLMMLERVLAVAPAARRPNVERRIAALGNVFGLGA